ncbi:NUDIX hydrolase [Longimicrobium sp.]|uniref:NUDIX hydrolase n=1 Tax=Longimicrobium sp. TaxID=2029185 RepID=UPI003B3AB909
MVKERRPRPWQVMREEQKGEFDIFTVRSMHARSPEDGSVHEFNVACAPDGVAVIAVTPGDQLVMVEQWRHPLQRVTLELPAGTMDEGERPEDAGTPELREETGYEGSEPEWIGAAALNPSWQNTRVHAVVVRGVRRAGEKELDEGEETGVRCVPVADVKRMVAGGEIDSATTVAALAAFFWRREAELDG